MTKNTNPKRVYGFEESLLKSGFFHWNLGFYELSSEYVEI